MSIREDWNRFKNPVKQAGRNIGSDLRDFSEEERQKEIERNRQTTCEEFYGYTDTKYDNNSDLSLQHLHNSRSKLVTERESLL